MTTKVKSGDEKQSFLYSAWIGIKNRFVWACNTTNLHGFKILAHGEVSIIARLFFAIVSCLSLGLCSYLILMQISEYNQQLILTRIVSTSYPVWKFRFPSATICNLNVVHKNNINNLMNLTTSHGIKREIFMDFLQNLSALITYDDNLATNVEHFKEIYEILEQHGYTVDRTMEELAQPCENMVRKCFWRAAEIPCSQIIQRTRTNNGFCCSFNYYGGHDHAEVIDPQNLNDTYMGFIGSNYGLRLLLDAEEDLYVSSIKPSYGFNILVQDGGDYPDMSLTTNTLHIAQEMKLSVKPSIYVSSKNVKLTELQQRQCLFEEEGNLEWSSVYSYRTCLIQCSADTIFELCGCIPFYYAFNNLKRICNFFDEPCLELNKHKYTTLHVLENILTGDITGEDEGEEDEHDHEEEEDDHTHCQCLPQCNERIYSLLTNKYSVTSTFGHENENLSILNVYYNDANSIKTKRDVYYTWYRILAAVGGIFSLCLGGSLISVVECFYIFGKWMYKNNINPNPETISKPFVTHIHVNASHASRKNVKKQPVVNVKTDMFIKAFGNHT